MPETVKKNTHGGRREGAGGVTREAQEAKKSAGSEALKRFTSKAFKDLDALYQAQKDLALGYYYEGCDQCEKPLDKCKCLASTKKAIRVYKAPPNQRAGAELIQHTKGRAAVAQQVQADTTILLSLGCLKCGTSIPRPPKRGKADALPVAAGDDE
jgi:hypothetical protein